MTEHPIDSENYTYIVRTPGPFADPIFGTRHEAVGERAILESIGTEVHYIAVRKRYATDPV